MSPLRRDAKRTQNGQLRGLLGARVTWAFSVEERLHLASKVQQEFQATRVPRESEALQASPASQVRRAALAEAAVDSVRPLRPIRIQPESRSIQQSA